MLFGRPLFIGVRGSNASDRLFFSVMEELKGPKNRNSMTLARVLEKYVGKFA